jgi:hypothetical protein
VWHDRHDGIQFHVPGSLQAGLADRILARSFPNIPLAAILEGYGRFVSQNTRLTKVGNVYLCYYFVLGANLLRQHNLEYKAYYWRRYQEVFKYRHKRALVLTARKLVRLVHALLTKNEPYVRPRTTDHSQENDGLLRGSWDAGTMSQSSLHGPFCSFDCYERRSGWFSGIGAIGKAPGIGCQGLGTLQPVRFRFSESRQTTVESGRYIDHAEKLAREIHIWARCQAVQRPHRSRYQHKANCKAEREDGIDNQQAAEFHEIISLSSTGSVPILRRRYLVQ